MDTSGEYQVVVAKTKTKQPASYRDLAVGIRNNEASLLHFMAVNDPVQCYRLLQESKVPMQIGVNATFTPDPKRVGGEFKTLLAKKDFTDLNDIISKFRFNPSGNNYTTNQRILTSLQDINAITMTPQGYAFNNLKFS